MRKQLKMAIIALGLLTVGTVNAQKTTVSADPANPTIAKVNNGNGKGVNQTVRLVDNKGNIKYLQANNGITTLTEKIKGRFVTTWQLGGKLTTNTYITAAGESTTGAGDQKEFALDGLKLVTDVTTASDNAQDRGKHTDATASTGFTVLIRDEKTGAIQKIKLSDLLQVQSQHLEFEIKDPGTAPGTDPTFEGTPSNTDVKGNDVTTGTGGLYTGYTLLWKTDFSKVQVYRNGAKLRANKDYKLVDSGTAPNVVSKINLVPDTADADNNNNYWELAEGDIIEIHVLR